MKKLFFFLLLFSNLIGYAQYTLIPDLNFENALISKGIDNGTPDGKVLTANVEIVTNLYIPNRNISNLRGLQDFLALTYLHCGNNQLNSLDVTKNTLLNVLFCYNNQLTSLDVSKNEALITLQCDSNQIANLDVSNNTALNYLNCEQNQLTILNVSKNIVLKYCISNFNQITSIDFSNNFSLVEVAISNNKLTSLNLKNGKNDILLYPVFTYNPALTCIQVNNKSYSDANWFNKDNSTRFSEDCSKTAAITPPTITATGNQIFCPGTPLKIVESISITPDPAEPTTELVSIQISSGFVQGQDKLTLSGNHPNILSNWIQQEGKLNLRSTTGNKISPSDFETAIKDVIFETNNTSASGTRTFSIGLGTRLLSYLPSNGHYYEYVSSPGINWTKAKNEAAARKYYGQQGYLATLITSAEAQLAGAQSVGTGWIGGSDAQNEGEWKWVTGPEAGTTFWIGNSNGTRTSPFNFANWNAPLEPNDSNSNEDYAHITSTAVGNIGTWNDMTEQGDPAGDYYPNGYIVEYGDMPNDPLLNVSASTSLTIGKIKIESAPNLICNSGSFTLQASTSGLPIKWYDAAIGGTLLHIGTDFTTPILTSDKSYFADSGCTLTPRTEFIAVVNASPIITSTKTAVSRCGTGSVVLDAVTSAGTINWYNAPIGGTLLETRNSFTTPDITAKTTFYAEAFNNGCVSAVRVPIEVNVYPLPSVTIEEVKKCKLMNFELDASISGMEYLWSNGDKTQTITISTAGIFFVDITSPAPEKCKSRKQFTVKEYNIPEIQRVEVGEASIIIDIKQEEIYFEFSIDGINYQASNVFLNVPIGLQTAFVRDTNRCRLIQQDFTIFRIKKYFTPNNDGINDLWEINDMKNFPNSNASIYDRYGKLIITLNASKYSWDGNFNNNPLPSDDYWFRLKLDESKPEIKGHFSLKR